MTFFFPLLFMQKFLVLSAVAAALVALPAFAANPQGRVSVMQGNYHVDENRAMVHHTSRRQLGSAVWSYRAQTRGHYTRSKSFSTDKQASSK